MSNNIHPKLIIYLYSSWVKELKNWYERSIISKCIWVIWGTFWWNYLIELKTISCVLKIKNAAFKNSKTELGLLSINQTQITLKYLCKKCWSCFWQTFLDKSNKFSFSLWHKFEPNICDMATVIEVWILCTTHLV